MPDEMTFEAAVIEANRLKSQERMDVDRERMNAAIGKLIDADELRKKLERHRDMCGDIETQYGIDTVIRILNNTSTIIEAEVSE